MIIMMDPLSLGLPLNAKRENENPEAKLLFSSISIFHVRTRPTMRAVWWRLACDSRRTYRLIYDWIYGAKWAHTYGHVQRKWLAAKATRKHKNRKYLLINAVDKSAISAQHTGATSHRTVARTVTERLWRKTSRYSCCRQLYGRNRDGANVGY